MSQSLVILGRQPAIGMAELESIYGAESLKLINNESAVVNLSSADIEFNRLGGSVKLAKLLTIIETTNWSQLESYLIEHLPEHLGSLADGKLVLGLSAYNLKVDVRQINATGLKLKKVVKQTSRPCRIVPNKETSLSSAQVLHNKLFTTHNWELILASDGKQTYLAQTGIVQNIEAYAARDQKRPKRDARVGMLPPKLAQIIINLAVGPDLKTSLSSPESLVEGILDPFCGTGVVLQEGMLMGSNMIGSDRDERMTDFSRINLEWLRQKWSTSAGFSVLQADATEFQWPMPFYAIASETYLGRPLSAAPEREVLQKVIQDVDTIHKKFLKNVARQTKSGFRMCIAVPAWRVKGSFVHLPTLDHLKDLGYTRSVFKHVREQDLIYYREGQIVGRELVVLTRK